MHLGPQEIALLLLLGGWVGIDGTSFGQFMISRPLIAATLAGWIVGDPQAGALLGIVLEAFHLTVLPVGAARYPEAGPPAVAGGAVVAVHGAAPAVLLSALVFALVWEWLSGFSVRLLRQWNIRLFSVQRHPLEGPDDLERRHLRAMTLDLLRGGLLAALGLLLLSALAHGVAAHWGIGTDFARAAFAVLTAGLLGGTLRLFGRRGRLFAAGIGAGLVLLLLLRS